ncbi:Aste57867_14737 [Aphanomyces stellatus]|uniref:Aste57867_14737 protein n=1 Tax=Aphanomyces stellatus TaxID=120398 RepID=A0A485L1S1_9STRA|nr:hypothetical protein As57867_014682 [Aphanomyces stellatus]VFT91555.1 Aste57867_14737 [Aphanomyces stellatus]
MITSELIIDELSIETRLEMELMGNESVQDLLVAAKCDRVDLMQKILDKGHVDVNSLGDAEDADGVEDARTTLMCASSYGHVDAVRHLLSRRGIQVNIQSGHFKQSALMSASAMRHLDVVQALLESRDLDINLRDRTSWSALMYASNRNHVDVVTALLLHKDISVSAIEEAVQFLIKSDKYDMSGKLFIECCAQYLDSELAMSLLNLDMPIEIHNGGLISRQDHSFSWTTFMDVTHPVALAVRQSCVETILSLPKFEPYTQELLHELAFAKDQHGREVIQITDASLRKYFYDRLYYCGRYQMFQGPPMHVSDTSVVVLAYDHGICTQVFEEHKNSNGYLDMAGFVICNEILGRVASKFKKDKKRDKEIWQGEFILWDKDGNGMLSEDEFLRFCEQHFGGKIKVAMKFMKSADEYDREIGNRQNLSAKFALSVLPAEEQSVFQENLKRLNVNGGYEMSDYPFVMVMPAADRSLEDIYLKERPGENERRILLQQVAECLRHLHEFDLVHGDLKKLNVVRVGNQVKLIDFDATAAFGEPVGAKFSSGSLPPELFYELKTDAERQIYCQHWSNIESLNLDLWQKIKPKNGFVVKTYQHTRAELPYELVKAHPSLDVWAFGALMYQIYSGEELVSTDINQDVVEDKIAQAATWTQEKLNSRIQNKISNATVRDLLQKLLVVDPDNRMTMEAILGDSYFKVESLTMGQTLKAIECGMSRIDGKVDVMNLHVKNIQKQIDDCAELTKASLDQLAATTQDIMRGMFESTEVTIPTSFVILPVDMTTIANGDTNLDGIVRFMCEKSIELGTTFARAIHGTSFFVPQGEPLFLYLVDEIEGTPVVPTSSDQAYPIRIDTQSPQFLAVAMPYLQTGLKLLKSVNTVAQLAKFVGVSAGPFVEKAIQLVERAQTKSSVDGFEVVRSAIQTSIDVPIPVQRIRGAALRELKRFFNEMDPLETFSGLRRTKRQEN